MFRSLLKSIAGGIRWLLFLITVLLLIEEVIRVLVWVAETWGSGQALVDGAVLYKLGEAFLLLPFLVFVHFNGRWGAERAGVFAFRTRWMMRAGGLLALMAFFDLRGRVLWSSWMIGLILMALLLPPFMKSAARKRMVRSGYVLATLVIVLVLFVNLVSLTTNGGAIAPLPTAYPAAAKTEAERWQQDLDYMAENLELLHLNPYHAVSRERFAEEVSRLRRAIPELNEAEIKAGFARITAMIGDGHTGVTGSMARASGRYPIRFHILSDGLFVIASPSDRSDLLGGRVLRLGAVSADSAIAAAAALVPSETESFVLRQAARNLSDIGVLAALGIAESEAGLRVVVAADDTIEARIESGHRSLQWAPDPPPAFRARRDEGYWSSFFDDNRTAYLKYNSFTDPIGFGSFSAEFWKQVEARDCLYVIIDFRDNGGGMSSCFDPFFERVQEHDEINRDGHLYVLVDRGTFSSGSLYATILRRDTPALLAGEMMGGAPNGYGELRRFWLPNSRLQVTFSVKYFEIWPDSLPPFRIDIPVAVSSAQYFAAEDPVLAEVMARIRADLDSR